ncbi:MAG: DUF2080 family transposase-associated protein [Nanoarchaeota archaeon]
MIEKQIKEVRPWGNSAGVLLPKEWIGKQISITLIDRTLEIKKEVLKILENYLEDIIGIYLVGSYARNEQKEKSDIDILAISENTQKHISSGKYEIEIIPLSMIKEILEKNPILVYPKIVDAKIILNPSLLEDLRQIKFTKESLSQYLKSTREVIKLDERLIEKESKNTLSSPSVIYSSLLRLKTLKIASSIINNKKYTNVEFNIYLASKLNLDESEIKKLYSVYHSVYKSKRTKDKIPLTTAKALINLLKEEVKKYD